MSFTDLMVDLFVFGTKMDKKCTKDKNHLSSNWVNIYTPPYNYW
jgi:hypothetical protein